MKCKCNGSRLLGTIAGVAAGAVVGTTVGLSVKAMTKDKSVGIKASAKKALKTMERYIDGIM